jgi:ABC-type sugar transport system permease subunit
MILREVKATPRKDPLSQRLAQWKHAVFKERWSYAFIAPFFLLYSVFGFFPQAFSVVLSFSKWNGMGPVEYVGLANFQVVFVDKVFWQAMANSVIIFFMHGPLTMLLALVLAVLLNSKKVFGAPLYRLVVFLPYIMNKIAAGMTFRLLFDSTDAGLMNRLLNTLGAGSIAWLDNGWTARIVLTIMIIWGWVGWAMILLQAGLSNIDPEITEAALIDGATPVQAFFRITIPLLRPMILFCVVMLGLGSFGLFPEIYSLTGGGPINATITPFLVIFRVAFKDFRLGYASALAYVYFLSIFVVTLVQFRRYGSAD